MAAGRQAPTAEAETRLRGRQELHEVRAINRALGRLATEFGLGASDLVPAPRIAGREPPVRYVLETARRGRCWPTCATWSTRSGRSARRG